ncbi:SH3 domain-containing protein [Methylovorus glucosotrophus]|jgi:SH3-like domain-containing protein|uniref:SH3 domain-containing protein n=1 Tax=Methylovorus glucosotrophus TaxID=266009 RepID=UPI001331C1C6|nr:SH3 domain-containing protein [Methylovorus glucosotrophus]
MVQRPTKVLLSIAMILALAPSVASALEYRSVAVPRAILYDAPSGQGKKLYVIWQGYPLEVIVNLGDWIKVRDNRGGLNWIEAKQLATKRTVIVIATQASIQQSADAASSVVGTVEKDVVLDMLEMSGNGWIKVRHRDGLVGYLPTTAVWGY